MHLQGYLIYQDSGRHRSCQINIGIKLAPKGDVPLTNGKIAIQAVQFIAKHDKLSRQKEMLFASMDNNILKIHIAWPAA
jgi:hypothetical protein